jgi:hypothetical protein
MHQTLSQQLRNSKKVFRKLKEEELITSRITSFVCQATFFLAVLGFELRSSWLLGRLPPEPLYQPFLFLLFLRVCDGYF